MVKQDYGDRKDAVSAFLELSKTDEKVRAALDDAIDQNILSVATIIANERGFNITRAELAEGLVARLGLGEFQLNDPAAGPGQCQTDSGCRTPCVYCKSNRKPSLGDLINPRGGGGVINQ